MPTTPAPYEADSLAIAIREKILDRGISQREAAEMIGSTQQAVSRWIDGLLIPDAKWVPGLARFLNIPQAEVKAMRLAARRERMNVTRLSSQDAARLDRIESSLRALTRELRRLVESLEP